MKLRVIGLIYNSYVRLVKRFRKRSGKLFVNGKLLLIFYLFLKFLKFIYLFIIIIF